MPKNIFTMALESQVPDTVDVGDITFNETLQPKPLGVKETGELKSEEKPTKELGDPNTPNIADHDEIDAVAESQEHVLALEHLQAESMRYAKMAAALESIAEVAEGQMDDGETISPAAVSMITEAVDAGGIGEPMADSVALEAFGMDARVATESFIDSIKERADKVWQAAMKFTRKAREVTAQKLKRFADHFRTLPSILDKLEKEGEILSDYSAKPFQNSKWEKDIQDRLCAPSSTKTVLDAIANAADEYKEVARLVSGKLSTELASMKAAWRTEKADAVVAQMNRVLAALRPLAGTGDTTFKHASAQLEVNLPDRVSVTNTGGLETTDITYEDPTSEFSAGIKTATVADIKKIKQYAEQASNFLDAAWRGYFDAAWEKDQEKAMNDFYSKYDRADYKEEDRATNRKLVTKYVALVRLSSDLANAALFATADGLHTNVFAATKWVRYSIAEAKQAARGGK